MGVCGWSAKPVELAGWSGGSDVLICSDDIHNELILAGNAYRPLAACVPELAEHTITFIGAGKGFNVSGLGCAFAVIPHAERRAQFSGETWRRSALPTSMGLIAARGAYSGACEEWLAELRAYLTANRELLVSFVQAELPLMRTTAPEATYFAWLDCSAYVEQGAIEGSPFEFFLKRARVALMDGAAFGQGGQGCVRLNFATQRAVLEEALERVKRSLYA